VAVPCRRRPSWLRLAESLRCSRALCCRAVGQLARSLSALRLAPSRSRSRHRASSWPNLARSRRRPLAAALAAVLRLALAAGFLVVLSVSLQLSPLVRLLLSALWCWVAGLLWGVGSVCTLSPLLSALAGSLMSGCCCLWLPGSVPWLAVVASALWLALCLCCPPSAYRVARCCCRLCCTAAGLCWLCSASGLCWLAVVDLCAACTSRALSALAVSDWAAQAVAQPEPAWPRHAQRQRRVHLPAWGWGLGAGNR